MNLPEEVEGTSSIAADGSGDDFTGISLIIWLHSVVSLFTASSALDGVRKPRVLNRGSRRVGRVRILVIWKRLRDSINFSCIDLVRFWGMSVWMDPRCSPRVSETIFNSGRIFEADILFSSDNSIVASLNGPSTPRHSLITVNSIGVNMVTSQGREAIAALTASLSECSLSKMI